MTCFIEFYILWNSRTFKEYLNIKYIKQKPQNISVVHQVCNILLHSEQTLHNEQISQFIMSETCRHSFCIYVREANTETIVLFLSYCRASIALWKLNKTMNKSWLAFTFVQSKCTEKQSFLKHRLYSFLTFTFYTKQWSKKTVPIKITTKP